MLSSLGFSSRKRGFKRSSLITNNTLFTLRVRVLLFALRLVPFCKIHFQNALRKLLQFMHPIFIGMKMTNWIIQKPSQLKKFP